MKSLNQVTLIGNIGKDPETKKVNETTLLQFTLATTERYKDTETTEWHNIQVWGKLADAVGQYLSKGSKVFIQGKIEYREYEKDGQKKYYTTIKANDLIMLDSKKVATDELPFG